MTKYRWPARVLLTLVSLAIGVVTLEAFCRTYARVVLWDDPPAPTEDADGRPLPYRHAGYYSPEFFDEQTRIRLIPAPSGPHFLLADVRGTYINVVHGTRVTTDHPPNPARRVLVLGGSTVLSEQVPDDYTIPSFLQRLINAHCDTPVAVFNYGVNSMSPVQHVSRLMDEGVGPGDIVILYEGVNQVSYMVYEGGRLFGFESLPHRLMGAVEWASPASATAYVIADAWHRTVPMTISDAAALRVNVDRAGAGYRHLLVEAHRFAAAHGGAFVHFLQPHLFATPLVTPYRRALLLDHWATPPGIDIAFQAAYPTLREGMEAARQDGVASFDLSGLLAAGRVPGEVFLDFAHVNDVANEIVARAIFPPIADRIGDCSALSAESERS